MGLAASRHFHIQFRIYGLHLFSQIFGRALCHKVTMIERDHAGIVGDHACQQFQHHVIDLAAAVNELPVVNADDVADADAANSGTGWLLGWGHLLETILEATRDPKKILDDVVSDRPIAIMEQTSHSIWCNSKALQLLGFTASTPNPTGGIIMKNNSGEPNGILIDNAGELLIALALAPTAQSMENDYKGLVEFALPELAKYGITSVSEARTFWKRNQQDT